MDPMASLKNDLHKRSRVTYTHLAITVAFETTMVGLSRVDATLGSTVQAVGFDIWHALECVDVISRVSHAYTQNITSLYPMHVVCRYPKFD